MRSGGGWHGRGGWQQADLPPADDAKGWFAGRLPDGWFTGEAEISVDREEIIVVGMLPALGEEFTDDAWTRWSSQIGVDVHKDRARQMTGAVIDATR
jgi:hypothetical protein